MPNALLKILAKESGKDIATAEQAWEDAKKQADEVFKGKDRDSHYWAFVNSKTQEKLGLKSTGD